MILLSLSLTTIWFLPVFSLGFEASLHQIENRSVAPIWIESQPILQDIMNQAIADCQKMLQQAIALIEDETDQTVTFIFGANDATTRGTVQMRLQQALYQCAPGPWSTSASPPVFLNQDEHTFFTNNQVGWTWKQVYTSEGLQWNWFPTDWPVCEAASGDATELTPGWTSSLAGQIVLCEDFYNPNSAMPALPMRVSTADPVMACFSASRAGILIHELMHVPAVVNTGPIGTPNFIGDYAYMANVRQIENTGLKLQNADSYNMYAAHAYLGCTVPASETVPALPNGPYYSTDLGSLRGRQSPLYTPPNSSPPNVPIPPPITSPTTTST